MSDDRAVLRKKLEDDFGKPQRSAIAELEHRGYEVRRENNLQSGKSLNRRPPNPGRLPNKPRAAANDPRSDIGLCPAAMVLMPSLSQQQRVGAFL